MPPGAWKPPAGSLEVTEHKVCSWGAIFEVSDGTQQKENRKLLFSPIMHFKQVLSAVPKKEKEEPHKVFGVLGVPN